jgi:hypothetical protein
MALLLSLPLLGTLQIAQMWISYSMRLKERAVPLNHGSEGLFLLRPKLGIYRRRLVILFQTAPRLFCLLHGTDS